MPHVEAMQPAVEVASGEEGQGEEEVTPGFSGSLAHLRIPHNVFSLCFPFFHRPPPEHFSTLI